jgi:transposase-like protein
VPQRRADRRCPISKVAKFTDEQKYEIVLELVSGKLSHGEICRKYGISATYAYKLKNRGFGSAAGGDRASGGAPRWAK